MKASRACYIIFGALVMGAATMAVPGPGVVCLVALLPALTGALAFDSFDN